MESAASTPEHRESTKLIGIEVGVVMRLPLSRIVGEHKAIERLRSLRKVAFSQQAFGHFTENGLQVMAKYNPVLVTPESDNYRCVGGLRNFHLFRAGLPSTAEIRVIVFDHMHKREIEELFLIEMLLTPEVYQMTANDRRHMWSQWQSAGNAAFLAKTIRMPGLQTLARMLGCGERALRGPSQNEDTFTGRQSDATETI